MYAQALLTIEPKKFNAENFLRLLERNGDLKNAKKIMAFTEELMLKDSGNKKITLESARNINVKKLLESIIKKGDKVEEIINSKIIAGAKIVLNNERQLDFSLQKTLNEIFR